MSVQVIFSQEFENLVKEKARQLIERGEAQGLLQSEAFGELTVYIDNKPSSVIYSGEIKGRQVYVGADLE